jgi:hypothetical protein
MYSNNYVYAAACKSVTDFFDCECLDAVCDCEESDKWCISIKKEAEQVVCCAAFLICIKEVLGFIALVMKNMLTVGKRILNSIDCE